MKKESIGDRVIWGIGTITFLSILVIIFIGVAWEIMAWDGPPAGFGGRILGACFGMRRKSKAE